MIIIIQIHRLIMKKGLYLLILLLYACGNKMSQMKPVVNNEQPVIEQSDSDTVASIKEGVPIIEEDHSAPATKPSSSSSYSNQSSDNMRGFDPASEDDMDDNGMSRYMENNDDEGWD